MHDLHRSLFRVAMATTMLGGLPLARTAQAQGTAQSWDGPRTTPGNVPGGRGGSSTWDTVTTNWTNDAGTANATWSAGNAAFVDGMLNDAGACTGATSPIVTIAAAGISATGIRTLAKCGGSVRLRGGTLMLADGATLNGAFDIESPLVGLGSLLKNDETRTNLYSDSRAGSLTITKSWLWISRLRVDTTPVATARLATTGPLLVGGVISGSSANPIALELVYGGEFDSRGGTIGSVAGENGNVAVTGGLWNAGTGDIVVGDAGIGNLSVGGGSSAGSGGTIYIGKNGEVRANRIVLGQQASGRGTLSIAVGGGASFLTSGSSSVVYLGGTADDSLTGNVTAGTVFGGAGGGTVNFNGTSFAAQVAARRANPLTFAPTLTGNLTVTISGADVHLGGTNTYTGATTVASDGRLYLNGATLGTTPVTIRNGLLGGFGAIAGPVTFSTGGTAIEGRSGQSLALGALTLAADTQVNVTLGAPSTSGLFNVTGALTLDGVLNVFNGGGYGDGVYRLFTYGGALTDSGLAIGTLPGSSPGTIQTSVANQVNLVVGTVVAPIPTTLFWDGANTTANNAVNGGAGTWNGTTTNWTSAAGDTNYAWGGRFAVFQGPAGTVTVDAGGIAATGLQFAADGYRIEGGAIALAAPATLRVGDGSAAAYGATIASAITGAGGLDKTDLGRLTLAGASSYTGATSVSGGTLIVDGSIASATTVASGATLGGSGRTGNLTVATGATIAPGNSIGTLTVAGNYVQAAGSTYRVEITPAGQSDRLAISGTATIEGGTVFADKAAGTYLPGTRYTILTASGGRIGTYTALDQTMPFLNLALAYDANSVFLDVVRNVTSFCAAAATRNQCATGSGVESLGAGTLYNAVVSLPNNDAARGAFTGLSGEIYASARVAMIDSARLSRDTVLDRLAAAGEGRAIWGQIFGNWGESDGDGNAFATDRTTTGLLTGLDAPIGSAWRVGLAGGYTHTTIDLDALASYGTVNAGFGLAYLGAAYGALRLRGGIGYADLDLKARRAAAFTGFTDALRGKADGSLLHGFAEAGYAIPVGAGQIEPFAGYAAVRVRTDRFQETGGTAALAGLAHTTTFAFTSLGARADLAIGPGVSVQGSAAWRRSFHTRVPTARLAFAGGNAFTLGGTPLNHDEAAIAAGLALRITPRLTLAGRYVGTLGKDARDHSAQGALTLSF